MGSLKRNQTLINALLRLAAPDSLRIPRSIRLSAHSIFRSRCIVKTGLWGSSHHFPLDRAHGCRSLRLTSPVERALHLMARPNLLVMLFSTAAWIGPQVLSPSIRNDTRAGSTAPVERAPTIICESNWSGVRAWGAKNQRGVVPPLSLRGYPRIP